MKKGAILVLFLIACCTLFSQVDSVQNSDSSEKIPDSSLIKQPYPLNMAELRDSIKYPVKMRDAGLEGTVWIRVLIDSTGNYVKHQIHKSVHPWLDDAVAKHIPLLRFSSPVNEYGEATRAWVVIPFRFALIDETEKKGRRKKSRRRP
jgi:TonB family protein